MSLALRSGDVFERDFRVIEPLSEGGMGALFVVEQLSTGKKRALKLMLKSPGNDEEARRRFAQEARVGLMIESEHVVEVIAAGVDAETNTPWLVMELLEGEDLSTLLERHESLPVPIVHEMFQQLCHALGHAHELPVVHRDLKPENIFLARARVAKSHFLLKLLDFGIAKVLVDGRNTTGSIGTPLWMAPEQANARTRITPATDVWALGLLAFRLLTGKTYWIEGNGDGGGAPLMREVLIDDLPAASVRAKEVFGKDVPPDFDGWFAKCVVRDPAARFADARIAWEALDPILNVYAPNDSTKGFALKVQKRVSTGGNPNVSPFDPTHAVSKSSPSPTVNPIMLSEKAPLKKKFPIGIAIAGGLVLVGAIITITVAVSRPPGAATADVPQALTTTATPAQSTVAPPTASPDIPTAVPSVATSASAKPTAKPTATAHATAAPSAVPSTKPTATNTGGLNMVPQ